MNKPYAILINPLEYEDVFPERRLVKGDKIGVVFDKLTIVNIL